jgi:hypothetical protein
MSAFRQKKARTALLTFDRTRRRQSPSVRYVDGIATDRRLSGIAPEFHFHFQCILAFARPGCRAFAPLRLV